MKYLSCIFYLELLIKTKCIDEMVKYDLNLADIVWATEIDSTASAGAPVIDKWGQVLFR